MEFKWFLFLVVLALTLYNNGVQAYIHFEAYPLIALVGKAERTAYLTEYERRLAVPLLLPYGLTLLSNLALVFMGPAQIPVMGVVVLLALNMAVAMVSVILATPVYNRIKAAEQVNPADMSHLMGINLLRLLISTASSLVVLALLFSALTV